MHLGCWYTFWATDEDSFRNWGWISGTQIPCSGGSLHETACGSLEGSKESMAKRVPIHKWWQAAICSLRFTTYRNTLWNSWELPHAGFESQTCSWICIPEQNLYKINKPNQSAQHSRSQYLILSVPVVLLNFLSIPHRQCQDASFPCVYKTTCFKTWHIRQ